MALAGRLIVKVNNAEDVVVARQELKRFAAARPFRRDDLTRIEIVVAELATNMVKHAGGGCMTIAWLEGDHDGVRIEARDAGPGIANLQRALEPGFSTTGTLGVGLSAVREFADRFRIERPPEGGTRVEVEKWL